MSNNNIRSIGPLWSESLQLLDIESNRIETLIGFNNIEVRMDIYNLNKLSTTNERLLDEVFNEIPNRDTSILIDINTLIQLDKMNLIFEIIDMKDIFKPNGSLRISTT